MLMCCYLGVFISVLLFVLIFVKLVLWFCCLIQECCMIMLIFIILLFDLIIIHSIRLALDLADKKGVVLPTTTAANAVYLKAMEQQQAGDEDFSAVLKAIN